MKAVVFTMDVDWASEKVLDYSLSLFKENNIPLSIFLTHQSEVLQNANSTGVFEFGMHPNFFNGSTHGKSIEEVINHCSSLSEGITTSRSHGLMFSSNILMELSKQGINRDLSIINPLAEPILPIQFGMNERLFRRYSFNWEDDLFFYYKEKQNFYQLKNINLDILVVNFHPIHIYLNSLDCTQYEEFKLGSEVRNKGLGTETFLKELLHATRTGKLRAISLTEYFSLMDKRL